MKVILLILFFYSNYHQTFSNSHTNFVNACARDSVLYYKLLQHKTKKVSVTYTSNGILVIKDLITHNIVKRDTIGNVSLNDIKIEDYNNDGVKDIRYGYNSNYFYENILIFDPNSKTWKELKNIDDPNFAYSKRIPHSHVYYTYTPHGCGKNNWLSYLFVIEKFTVKPIGLLQYKQCADEQKGIYLYKIYNNERKLFQKFDLHPMSNNNNVYVKYWVKHYKQYLK